MGRGIDIYRYQTVTDWNAVRASGVRFVYVKGTDGGGPALVRADGQVRGAQSVGLPVGLYHYAQLFPFPEAQANSLTGEVTRLKAFGLPPALDLEHPHQPGQPARDFTIRFLNQLRRNGFRRVTLYANTSMLTGIGADSIPAAAGFDPDDVVIWAAQYSVNDGRRHPLRYAGRVNIHQYTSVGGVPGINGRVDLNEAFDEYWIGDDDVSAKEVWDELIDVRGTGEKASARNMVMETNYAGWEAIRKLDEQAAKLDLIAGNVSTGDAQILAAIRGIPGADPAQQAAMLAQLLNPMIQGGATRDDVFAMCDRAIRLAFDRGGADAGHETGDDQ
jgi:GH25 family lysozyme M1 (1,4-beta-N-acetylmuramidase)